MCSFASLLAEDASIYIATIRDCYEAWIIYNFMSLCLEYVGGPGAVEIKMQGVVLLPSWSACTCCLSPLQVNGQFIRSVKRGALQFVIVKPILAILTVILYATGHYTEGDWSVSGSYLWITIVYNITYTVALYALLLFYMGTHELLEPFRPLLKFILVKSVIFLTYWQGLIISIFVGVSIIPSAEDGNAVQNWLTSVEMLPAAIFMLFAFPWKEFASDAPTGLGRTQALHAMSVGDVVTDTMHQFAPTYQNYVLYSDGTAKGGPGGAFGKSYAGPMMQSHESDPGLLYDVEMSPYYDEATHPSADPAAKGTNATAASSHGMGRFLQRDESAELARRPVSKAEQRWNDINVGEG